MVALRKEGTCISLNTDNSNLKDGGHVRLVMLVCNAESIDKVIAFTVDMA